MSEWISVKERLPEVDVPVLVCEGGEVTTIARYCVDNCRPDGHPTVMIWHVVDNCTGYECESDSCNPDYWMPLPEPPK